MLVFHGYLVAGVELGAVTALGGVIFDSRGRVHSGGRESVTGREATGCFSVAAGSFSAATGSLGSDDGGSGPAKGVSRPPDRVAIGRSFFSFVSDAVFAKPCGENVASDVASIADARQKRLRLCFIVKESLAEALSVVFIEL